MLLANCTANFLPQLQRHEAELEDLQNQHLTPDDLEAKKSELLLSHKSQLK